MPLVTLETKVSNNKILTHSKVKGVAKRYWETITFEPLLRGGSFSFQLFYNRKWRTIDTTDNKGNSLQKMFQKMFRAVAGALAFFYMDYCSTYSKGQTIFNFYVGVGQSV